MKRIDLQKYGFYRIPSQDFSDDGAFFRAYQLNGADRIIVYRTRLKETIYITTAITYCEASIEELKSLPHYDVEERFNGVPMESITGKDLKQFALDCIEYDKEYKQLEKSKKVSSLIEQQGTDTVWHTVDPSEQQAVSVARNISKELKKSFN